MSASGGYSGAFHRGGIVPSSSGVVMVHAGEPVIPASALAVTCGVCGVAKDDPHETCPSCGKLDRPPKEKP